MKNQLTKLHLQHAILIGEMQVQSRLSKTLQDLLRQELSQIESSIHKNKNISEIEVHSKLAKTLEIELRFALSQVEECFNEMESFSVKLLSLHKNEGSELQEVFPEVLTQSRYRTSL